MTSPSRDGSGSRRFDVASELRHSMPSFAAVRAFEAIGSYGGIRRAALALSLDHAAVSRHLRGLELWAGVPLVDRTPGAGGRLTPEGARYHARISAALLEIARAGAELTRSDDHAFRIWCAPGLASEWLTARLGNFADLFPDVELELQPTEAVPDFAAREADVHIHYVKDIDRSPYSDIVTRSAEVFRPPILPVATPEFLERTGMPTSAADLLGSTLLHESSVDQWRRWFAAHGIEAGDALAGPKFWHAHLTVAAARRSQGIALANIFLVHDDLEAGVLREVEGPARVNLGAYVFTARHDRWRNKLVSGFRNWLDKAVRSLAEHKG